MSAVDLARVGACVLKHAVTGEVRPDESGTAGGHLALGNGILDRRWGPGRVVVGLGARTRVGSGPAALLVHPTQAVELRSLWREQACVVAGLRRFGCSVCRWIARDLSSLRGLLDRHGVRLVGVGPEALGLQEFLDGGYFSGGACALLSHSRRPASCLETPAQAQGIGHPLLAQP